MGDQGKLLRFFRHRREGLETSGRSRPAVEIPDNWHIDWIVGRLVLAGLVKWKDLAAGDYGWAELWQLHDFLDLQDWLEWQHHAAAHNEATP